MVDVSPSEHPLLYRAIKSPTWFRVRSAAFKLRGPSEARPEAERDLSVILSANCNKDVCDANQARCHGEFVLMTAAVIADGWRVGKDDPANSHHRPTHASILGLPLHGSDELQINLAASRLTDLIDSVQPRPTE